MTFSYDLWLSSFPPDSFAPMKVFWRRLIPVVPVFQCILVDLVDFLVDFVVDFLVDFSVAILVGSFSRISVGLLV